MSPVTTQSVVRQIGSLFDGGSVAGLTDRQLIERFTARRDSTGEAAFAALVSRHGPMVMDICRQVLGTPHDAEDAFQAAFLVLACHAPSIRDPDLLGSWLYAVALRTARKARAQIARRRKTHETAMNQKPERGAALLIDASVPTPEQTLLTREQAGILYSEIDRLPPSFRQPVVLHYFEGLTLDDTACRLRCPAGTVRSRLARACDKLRRGLMRRGVALSTAAVASALSSHSASAGVSPALCETASRAAMNFAAHRAAIAGGISAAAAALAQGVLRSMLFAKLRLVALALLLMAAIATGVGYGIYPVNASTRTGEGESPSEPRRNPARTEPRPSEIAQEANKPAPGRMFVVGRVLDTQGHPVPNASVLVYAITTTLHILDRPEGVAYATEIGRAKSDDTGRIRVDVPRTASSSHDDVGVVALAPGHGAGWLRLDADAEQPVAEITLPPEQVIDGRVFDFLGQPAGNVRISVTAIRRVVQPHPDPRRARYEGPRFSSAEPDDLPGWPRTAVSDANGRFTLRGVGRGFRAFLTVVDPRFVTQVVETDTDENSSKNPLAIALQPARTLSGRVTYADTGKPVSNVRIGVRGFDQIRLGLGSPPPTLFTTTDHEGRYRANPRGGAQGTVYAVAPHGEPYLGAREPVTWPKGAITHSTDLVLERGVLIRGKVTELLSHQPVAGAIVALRAPDTTDTSVANPPVRTSADGSFILAARSRRGVIVVNGPTSDYVRREVGEGLLTNGPQSGRRFYYHAFLACDQKPEDPDHEISLTLEACRPIKGRMDGPDGKPLTGTWIISGLHFADSRFPHSQHWNPSYHGVTHNGQFELNGLAPDAEVSVSFLQPKLKLGATLRVSGKPGVGEPIVVRLARCGTATARLVGPDGRPLGNFTPQAAIMMVVMPGELSPMKATKEGKFMLTAGVLTAIDPVNYAADPASDGDGRIVFPALIPGTTYHLVDRSTVGAPPGMQLRKEFRVKSGEIVDLGDILIEKPQALRNRQ
jgi:RNA polymerase sigma factor (sigma-70 family)